MSALRRAYKPRIPMPSHQCSMVNRETLPRECGVYAISQGFECLLVGSATDVGKALQSLHKVGDVQITHGCTAQFWRCRSEHRQAMELSFIYSMDPKFNIHLPDDFVKIMTDYLKPDSSLAVEDIERFFQHFQANRAYKVHEQEERHRKKEVTRLAYLAAFSKLSDDELDTVQDALDQIRRERRV
ncbi:hypothetical protein [Photobacterium sp. DNB22_13_2]